MRLLVTAQGAIGDGVPLLAVALALRARGHEVIAGVAGAIGALFENEGFSVLRVGRGLDGPTARAHVDLFEDERPASAARRRALADLEDMPACYRDLARIARARAVEGLVAGGRMRAARHVAEDLGRPLVLVHTRADLPEGPREVPSVVLSSPAFAPIRAQGFHRYEGAAQPGWTEPSAELVAFVRAHDGAFVVWLPGSAPLPEPARELALHRAATRALGLGLVVQPGWSRFEDVLPGPDLFLADPLPHAWLLERAAAVITPGRPGVIAHALRAGCPLLCEPRSRDDFYNAGRVRALGAGGAIDPRELTDVGLRRMLDERVLGADIATDRFRAEDGAARAADMIPSLLGSAGR